MTSTARLRILLADDHALVLEGLRSLLDAQPDNPDALHMSGVIAHQTGKVQRAVTLITRAKKGYPAMPELHNNLGLALQSAGRIGEAEVRSLRMMREPVTTISSTAGAWADWAGAFCAWAEAAAMAAT